MDFSNVFQAIKSFVLKSRPAYKDYAGETTSETLYDEFVWIEDASLYPIDHAVSDPVIGDAYRIEFVNQNGSISEYTSIANEGVFLNEPVIYLTLHNGDKTAYFVANRGERFITDDLTATDIPDSMYYIADTIIIHHVIATKKYDIKKLPEECVPDGVTKKIAKAQSTAETAQSTAETAQSTAETAQSTAESVNTKLYDGTFLRGLNDNDFCVIHPRASAVHDNTVLRFNVARQYDMGSTLYSDSPCLLRIEFFNNSGIMADDLVLMSSGKPLEETGSFSQFDVTYNHRYTYIDYRTTISIDNATCDSHFIVYGFNNGNGSMQCVRVIAEFKFEKANAVDITSANVCAGKCPDGIGLNASTIASPTALGLIRAPEALETDTTPVRIKSSDGTLWVENAQSYIESERVFEWDGDTSGRTEYSTWNNKKYYKVSDVSDLTMRDFWFADVTQTFKDGTSKTCTIYPGEPYRNTTSMAIDWGGLGEFDDSVLLYFYSADGDAKEIGLFFKANINNGIVENYISKIVLKKYRRLPIGALQSIGWYYWDDAEEPDCCGISLGSPLNKATGNLSVAEGYGTTASGDYSHAEGYETTSSRNESHAEGSGTTASGDRSHAEGTGTEASGDESHAEGYKTTASGDESHAEGSHTIASGDNAHAEGYKTTASGDESHAEGSHTIASGDRAHAEGIYVDNDDGTEKCTTASGDGSHAEGEATQAIGKASHAEGGSKKAEGDYSHAEGKNTQALGQASHAEGIDTTAQNDYSHAEGGNTRALNVYAHAEGNSSIAGGYCSHAEGHEAQADGEGAHAEGCRTRANSNYQHVQGKYNVADDAEKYAHIVGNGTDLDKRSNAHTLDWEGNAWYAGTVEGTAVILKSSTPNSTKRFKITVDDSGTISASEVTT